jgi:RNA polymerase sigma factor (sigma-70 family)
MFPVWESTECMASSFDEAFEAEVDSLHRYLSRRVGSDAAEDLTAETFAVAYRRWDDLDPSRHVRPWLYGIATHLMQHHWRKERRRLRAYAEAAVEPLAQMVDSPEQRLDAGAKKAELAAGLAKLRTEDRDVLLLHAWAELSDAEMGEALSVPLGTIKSRLNRARQQMKNHLGSTGKEQVDSLITAKEMSR